MRDENCIFCKIMGGEIPSTVLYEDEIFRVILDVGPATRGHALIIPKEHYRDLYELPDEVAGKAMILAKKMITALAPLLRCAGYNIMQNNGEAAGQTVPHFHLHLIPRYENDDAGLGWHVGELTDQDRQELTELISQGHIFQ